MTTDQVEPPASMVMVRVGNRDWPAKHVSTCHVCTSPHRLWIEARLIDGYGYRQVVEAVRDMPGDRYPKVHAVARHVTEEHMALPVNQQRQMIEARARRVGQDPEDSASLADYGAVNEWVIQKGYERLNRGEIQPDMKDLLTAIKNQQTIDAGQAEGVTADDYLKVMFVYLEIAQKYIPAEAFAAYGNELTSHPVLRQITAKMNGPETVPGETE